MYNEDWTMISKHDTFNKRKIYGIALRKFTIEKIREMIILMEISKKSPLILLLNIIAM